MVEPVPSDSAEDEPERDNEHDEQGAGSGGSDSSDGSDGQHRAGKKKKQRSFWKELPILIVVALVLAFLIQHFLARVYYIPSASMEDTLRVGDRILVDKVTYEFTDVQPGDVVVFKGPKTWVPESSFDDSGNGFVDFLQSVGSVFGLAPPDEKDFVKRVIATGGQTVSCCAANGHVVVDGVSLREPYIYWPPGQQHKQREFAPVTVPQGEVWVMGDNRTNSADSRYQGGGGKAGAVPVENIIGEARFIVLPPSHWTVIDDPNPQKLGATASAGEMPGAIPGEVPGAVAMSAPAWQQGIPLGAGVLAAWPTVALGRRLGSKTRRSLARLRP